MLDAIEVPFDASKYAFRTNFDGLTATDEAVATHLETIKPKYQEALTKFESEDKDAREDYKYEKDNGSTTASFQDWTRSPQKCPQWANAKNTLESLSAQLTQTATVAYGQDYTTKLQKEQSEFSQRAMAAGHYPLLY